MALLLVIALSQFWMERGKMQIFLGC